MIFNGVAPHFDLAEGGLWLALTRALFVSGLFLSYGTTLFRSRLVVPALKLMPPGDASRLNRIYRSLAIGSIAASLFFLCLWLLVQTWALAGTVGFTALLQQVPIVLGTTSFGHTLLLQVAALSAALAIIYLRKPTSETFAFVAFMTGCAIVAQAWHGHAAAMYDGFSPLLLSEIAHLLAASAWLGSLVPLLILVHRADGKTAYAVASRFAGFGTVCVLTLLVTAAWQGYVLIGTIPGLIGTAYGWMALVKGALFTILLGFAALNRYRLTPSLRMSGNAARLMHSIILETVFGVTILFAASILLMLPPAMHTQAVWPFTKQPSLITLHEAPELRPEVMGAILAILSSIVLIVAALFVKRLRYVAPVLAAIIAWFAVPHLDLLFVEAYPTSFYHSPTGFSASSITAGAKLFTKNCASCHGQGGQGDGPAAADLTVPPADLTAGHLWGHSDGELFWWLTDGIDGPDGNKAMPAFGGMLSEEERWQLIDFIRANNAGVNHMQVQAPVFSVQCMAGETTLDALRGQVVRIIFGADHTAPQAIAGKLVTILIDPGAKPDSMHCTSFGQDLLTAYAAISGVSIDEMPGRQFLIDPNGWIRAWQIPGVGAGWNDPQTLLANVQEIVDHPLSPTETNHVHHHHH